MTETLKDVRTEWRAMLEESPANAVKIMMIMHEELEKEIARRLEESQAA